MYSLLFERPVALAVAWGVAEFLIICMWSWTRVRSIGRLVWFGLGALPLLLSLSILTVTPTERIQRICLELASAVGRSDVDAIESRVAGSFEIKGLDRRAFLQRTRGWLETNRLDNVRMSRVAVSFAQPGQAVVDICATARIRTETVVYPIGPVRWRLRFRLQGDAWRLIQIDPRHERSLLWLEP